MTRNRIRSNTSIFQRLDDYCKAHDLLLETHSQPRWISTNSRDRHVLDEISFAEITNLGGQRYLGYGALDNENYLITCGFNFPSAPFGCKENEVGPGHITAILSEFPIPVVASPYEVKDVVDLHDISTPGYSGHEHTQILKVFPRVRIFSLDKSLQDPWNGFFKLCLNERDQGFDRIDRSLHDSLISLADLDPDLLPYRVLCRSIFDSDPSSFFLALYRCLESLYSYTSAKDLGRRFGLERDWREIASTVEDVTGWYPREASSLESLLQMASPADLRRLIEAAGEELSDGQSPSTKAAKVIYGIRNSTVHYRPVQQSASIDKLEWSDICEQMVGIILDVYVGASHTV